MKRQIVEMNLTLVTTTTVKQKPAYTFTGGIEIKLKDGREFCLDFTETKWQEYTKKKGLCEVYVCQRWLDEDYVKGSNKKMKLTDMTDIQFIKDNAVSIAVYFEAERKNEEEYLDADKEPVEFEVKELTFKAMDEAEDIDFTPISTLQ